eukprot:COSAG01_NODE_4057_length_5389_cov_15.480340_1_plen_36_part_10
MGGGGGGGDGGKPGKKVPLPFPRSPTPEWRSVDGAP